MHIFWGHVSREKGTAFNDTGSLQIWNVTQCINKKNKKKKASPYYSI